MRECTCIVIDDNRSITTSATMTNLVQRALEKNKLTIKLIHLNPKDQKFVDEDGAIIIERIAAELDSKSYLKQSIQLIVCDYNLGDESVNGFEIIRLLRNKLNCSKTILLYSSNIDDVIAKILQGKDQEVIKEVIIDLVKSKISAFCKRDDHLEEEIVKHLGLEVEFSMDKYFESELYRLGEYKFEATYDKFQGMKLAEVAEHISKHSGEAIRLKKELVQQLVAYLVDIDHE